MLFFHAVDGTLHGFSRSLCLYRIEEGETQEGLIFSE
jgi:hypothetical protein